MQKIKWC